ncbi:MAG: leucine-rich repeat protein [Bacteroides sp.]|nr:leucine-rich repeat protein [Bacteroides sp.]
MEDYPLISEYREAIMSPEDNFGELTSLRPVLDSRGEPVMSSGNFAVVFKMRDEKTGRLYAVKCFTRPQEGRAESYRRITEELESVSSAYMVPMRWLDNELFVDTTQCDREEFPVVVMEWVEGEPLDLYVSRHLDDTDALSMLSYRFNRMAVWLLAQPFAHGDLKPDNILVRADGSPVLVDYDGMFVPSMQGEKAREAGSPDYRHPLRTDADFNEHIDDFSVAVIALSLKALALNPSLRSSASADTLLFSEADFRNPANSRLLQSIALLTTDPDLTLLLGTFYITLAKKFLDLVSFRLFMTPKPKLTEKLSTAVTDEDIANGVEDEYGVVYSKDGKRLLKCKNGYLTEYAIKAGTKVIGDSAFFCYKALQSVSIPSSVTAIGNSAFSACKALQSVSIPSSVTTIGNYAFSGCTALQSVSIPSSVTTIGNYAFSWCEALQSVSIPSSVTTIGNYAFSACTALQSVSIPSSVTAIGNETFDRCTALQSVSIPASVTAIGDKAFSGCEALQSVNIPASVTAIGNSAFSGCTALQSVSIPSSVTTIGNYAFSACKALQSVSIPSSLTAIGDGVFSWCKALQSVSIPASVTAIGDRAFIGCKALQSVNIPSSVTAIGDWAFSGCTALQSVSIPASVTAIGDGAFWGCEALQSVSIPSSVTAIGDGAFSRCTALQSVSIPSSVTAIGTNPFIGCHNLQINLSYNNHFRIIDNLLISDSGNLISCLNTASRISIPSSVTAIGNEAFYNCEALQSVRIPTSVTAIGDYAFYECTALQSINIPSSVTAIGYEAFPFNCYVNRV